MGQILCGKSRAPEAVVTMHPLAAAMGKGINLGNIFELPHFNTGDVVYGSRHMTMTEFQALLDKWKEMGFQHIRIPVRWFNPNGTDNRLDNLDENLLEEVVTYAIRKGFYVIMNDHHNNWMMNGYNDTAVFNEAFCKNWVRVSKQFEKFDHHLLFEVALLLPPIPPRPHPGRTAATLTRYCNKVLNEPHGIFGSCLGNQNLGLTRRANFVGYSAIRSVSPKRFVLVQGPMWGSLQGVSNLYPCSEKLPTVMNVKDPFVGVAIHFYDPADFTLPSLPTFGGNRYFTSTESIERFVDKSMGKMNNWLQNMGNTFIIMNEWGAGRPMEMKNELNPNIGIVQRYIKAVAKIAMSKGMSTTIWNDFGWFSITKRSGDDEFELVAAIINPCEQISSQ